jgi:hypothetical protein
MDSTGIPTQSSSPSTQTPLTQPDKWPTARIIAIVTTLLLVAACYLLRNSILSLAVVPLILGAIVVALSQESVTLRIDRWQTVFSDRGTRTASKESKFAKYFSRPLWAGARMIWTKTETIGDSHIRAGVRLAVATVYFGFMVFVLVSVGYVAVIIIVGIAMIMFMFWLLGKFLGWDSGKDEADGERVEAYPRSLPSTSRKVDGFFGSHVEHRDDSGAKTGESREVEGVFGKYIEHSDKHGNKIGESHERDGLIEKYVEHTDQHGDKVGETREREGMFGQYSEHTDEHGDKVGESRRREGLLGDYIEHKKEAS